MLLRNRHYLSDAAAQGKEGQTSSLYSWRKPLWIVPRSWCATTSIQAKGIPRRNTAAFIRLHLSRLAPFVDSGVYACRAGDWVHLWFWENQRVRDFCQRHDLDFETIELAPESVCLPKLKEGAALYRSMEGVEAQLWHHGLLVDSTWWPDAIDASTWESWRSTTATAVASRGTAAAWPESLPALADVTPKTADSNSSILCKPWASNLLGAQWWHGVGQVNLGIAATLAAGLLVGFAGFLATEWWILKQTQDDVDKKIALLSARVEPLQATRGKALEYLQWTSQVASLSNRASIREVLDSLRPVLFRQDAVLREFEYVGGEARLTLVPANTELNIAAVIQQIEALPNLTNIQLLPDSDSRIMRVSAKTRRIATPASSVNTPALNKIEVSK